MDAPFSPPDYPEWDYVESDWDGQVLPNSVTMSGTITAVLTWTPDSPSDTSTPPKTVYLLAQAWADATNENWDVPPTATATASDGFGDPQTEWFPGYPGSVTSGGSRLLTLDNSGGSSVVRVKPAQSLSASYTPAYWWDVCGASISYTVNPPAQYGLAATYINKDLPFNMTYQALPNPPVLYGGSVRFTSDELLLNAANSNDLPGTTYTWSASGPGGYTPPSNSPTWNVVIAPAPGLVTFTCLVQPPGAAPILKTLTVEVGIRTDDVIMVGWINGDYVTVNAAGVDPPITADMPPVSPPSFNPFAASRIIALAQNDDCIDYDSSFPQSVYSQADKDYILDWMFKYAPNPDPTPTLQDLHTTDWTNPNYPAATFSDPNPVPVNTSDDFTCYAGYIDYIKYQAYLADGHRFKLLNHFQVKYRVNLTNPSVFNGAPILLHNEALIGQTVNPTGIPPDLGPVLGFLTSLPTGLVSDFALLAAANANHALLDPQAGPANGVIGPVPTTDHISQINDGSPDIPAIRAFNTLEGLDVANPIFWQNIGSKITFKCPATSPSLAYENYPTYNQYENGQLVTPVNVQAGKPQAHFYANPYPFGTDPSYGLPPQLFGLPVFPALGPSFPTIPGGRNGVATTPGDASSSSPAYSVP